MIEVHKVKDVAVVKAIMTQPDIWATISEDGQDPDSYQCDVIGEHWLLMTTEDYVVGIYNIHAINSIQCQIHAHVFPEHRKEHSYETGVLALKWLYDNEPSYQKLIAIIPVIYENVKKFTCQFGFHVEGLNRLSFQKNGEIVDQYLLGITRQEINEYLTMPQPRMIGG